MKSLSSGIPISVSFNPSIESENGSHKTTYNKKRLFTISSLAVFIAVFISFIAKLLVYLIDLITNISFYYGHLSIEHSDPANNTYGLWVLAIPTAGGLIVGMMALYGSKAIRGHGIPEAMEQILTNQSKIKPSVLLLKPLSSAISIGTGGPFGAEGPIIATGGALGSTIGQILKISDNERKILLAAGATAGMAAIFGSPIAAIFLAIELLLFEFSPRSFIPVALACITGAAGHHLLFGGHFVFETKAVIQTPSNTALFAYSMMGVAIGLLSVLVTGAIYFIEDLFEKLPVHWAWWPAIGGLAVGIVGYFSPRTLGVGYNNITDILTGDLSEQLLLSLCVMKFISWSVSLASGTSGGTLAPLLMIGGAMGALLGTLISSWFPMAGVTVPLAALVGMSAMFAGASRAYLTSIVFALETTGQSHALLPLLAACTASYFVSFFIMENTIMTEKIARRGVKAPDSYKPDNLEKFTAGEILTKHNISLNETDTIDEIRKWLNKEHKEHSTHFVVTNSKGLYEGIVSASNLFNHHHDARHLIKTLVKCEDIYVTGDTDMRTALEIMAKEEVDALPVISNKNNTLMGILSYQDIIATYKHTADEREKKKPHISLKRKGLKILVNGKKIVSAIKSREK